MADKKKEKKLEDPTAFKKVAKFIFDLRNSETLNGIIKTMKDIKI